MTELHNMTQGTCIICAYLDAGGKDKIPATPNMPVALCTKHLTEVTENPARYFQPIMNQMKKFQGKDGNPLWEENWEPFLGLIKQRLEHGAREYGDESFKKQGVELVGMIEEEVLDIVGWAFVMWVAVRQFAERMRKYETEGDAVDGDADVKVN